jgi:hypothetical protein
MNGDQAAGDTSTKTATRKNHRFALIARAVYGTPLRLIQSESCRMAPPPFNPRRKFPHYPLSDIGQHAKVCLALSSVPIELNLKGSRRILFPRLGPDRGIRDVLQRVVHRKPVPFRPHESESQYLLVYCIETLACGHTVNTFPQTDPLTAVRRDCRECDGQKQKKPAASVLEMPARKQDSK